MVPTSRILELYYAVRLAYKGNYDFFKYNGKLGKAYDGENSQYYSTLLRIQKNFNTEERVCQHFAFNSVGGDKWLPSIADQRSLCVTQEFEKRSNSLDTYFRQDVEKIALKYPGKEGLKKFITEKEFNAPMFSMMLGGHIHFSTFAYIDSVTNASSHWKSKVWKTTAKRVLLTEKFMRIDLDKKLEIKKIIFEVFSL
jgi:hypothetical protein